MGGLVGVAAFAGVAVGDHVDGKAEYKKVAIDGVNDKEGPEAAPSYGCVYGQTTYCSLWCDCMQKGKTERSTTWSARS